AVAPLRALIDKLGVRFLNVGGVAEHGLAQVDGGRSRVNWPGKSVADECGQVSAVVDVGVGEHYRVDGARVERQVAVAILGILAAALVEAAIEQVAFARQLEMV